MTASTGGARSAVRVLQLTLWLTPGGGGTQTYLRALLQAFRGDPAVQLLGAAVNPGEAPEGFATPPTLGQAAHGRWRRGWDFARRAWRAARGASLVQIHGINGPQFMCGAPCCWLLGVPYLVNPHNALAPWMLAHKAWKKRLYLALFAGFFLRRAACVLATSEPEADALRARFPRLRVRLVRPGLAVPERPAVAPAAGPLRVLYLGSFDPWKRVPALVRAVGALRAEGCEVQATLCGTEPAAQRQAVAAEVERLGLAGAVTLPGYVAGARKLELLRQAHVLVLPAVTDSYSVATAEALAQGLPVVITEGAGAAPDVRRHGCGTVVPVDDAAALAAAIRAHADPALRRERGLAAHRYAREVLDLPVLRAALGALYRELAR